MFNIDTPEMKFALHAVVQAAQVVRQVQSELVSPAMTKDDRSPVTVADFASQALVSLLLAEAFPDDCLVAEEDSTALHDPAESLTLEQVTHFVGRFEPEVTPETVCDWIDRGRADPAHRFWTLDPIDGTKGFLRGDQYAVALALIVGGQVQLGVLGCPSLNSPPDTGDLRSTNMGSLGTLVVAGRGRGTWAAPLDVRLRPDAHSSYHEPGEFKRVYVSKHVAPSQARLLRSFESGHTNVGQIDEFAHVLGVQAEPVRMDSQAKYAVMAAGGGELLLRLLSPAKPNYREKIWDQAAGSLVIEEAGGRVTDIHGKRLDFTAGRTLANNRGILASNGHLHPAALRALQAIGA